MAKGSVLSETMGKYNDAISHLATLPPGDTRARKARDLEKARNLLVFADKKLSEGHNVSDIIFRCHQLIEQIYVPAPETDE